MQERMARLASGVAVLKVMILFWLYYLICIIFGSPREGGGGKSFSGIIISSRNINVLFSTVVLNLFINKKNLGRAS